MVWGGISIGGRTDLMIIDENLTAQRYVGEILRPHVLPYAVAVGNDLTFQDDNARPHRGRVANAFVEDECINRMDCPAVSPDLNPIEHLWDILGRKVNERLTADSTIAELRGLLHEEWIRIPQRTIDNLLNSMRRRCAERIAENGGHTHY